MPISIPVVVAFSSGVNPVFDNLFSAFSIGSPLNNVLIEVVRSYNQLFPRLLPEGMNKLDPKFFELSYKFFNIILLEVEFKAVASLLDALTID